MTDTFKRLDQRLLPAAATLLYTAPTGAGGAAIVKPICIVNVSTSTPASFILFQGGGATANTVRGPITLDPGSTYIDPTGLVLGAGDTIYGMASVAGVLACTLAGDEVT